MLGRVGFVSVFNERYPAMSTTEDFPDYARTNRAHWNRHADWWAQAGQRNWAQDKPTWGIWGTPNDAVPLLPDSLAGLDTIELGCGTAYVSYWMLQRGARSAVGIDPSDKQLATAQALCRKHGVEIELIHGVAESVPKPDASFDFAISEYGAAIWADPYIWIPEARRLLQPGGRLHIFGHSPFAMTCCPHSDDGPMGYTLLQDYFGMYKIPWISAEDPSVEFNLPVSEWFRLFKQNGFVVEDFFEVQPPPDAEGEQFGTPAEWARRFPSEQAWRLRAAD